MSMDILGTLFDSPARVKIMRLFLLNQKAVLRPSTVSSRSNVTSAVSRRELALLSRAGFIVRRKERQSGKMIEGWTFNNEFEFTEALQNLLFGTEFINLDELGKRFKKAGKVKLLLLSGVFNHSPSARLDLLIVGDNLKRPVVDRIIRSLEAEIGKELAYAAFETSEFVYRASMYDKLIRDVIDFPHEKIISVGGLLAQVPQLTS
jgi:hypothetical protein